MRILIAAKRMPGKPGRRDGGVQTWIATVRDELVRSGHSVCIVDKDSAVNGRAYDLGIFANWHHVRRWQPNCSKVVNICHGIVDDEAPADGALFTSEELKDHWRGTGRVIRQPVDLGFWSPGGKREDLIVRYAARGGLEWLPGLADMMGHAFIHVRNLSHWNARQALRRASCVIASGRCAVEAMACGAPVVICDDRHYQGPLLDPDTFGAMARNYSGRGGGEPTEDSLRAAIIHAMDRQHLFRAHAELHHDVRDVVRQILEAAG
ncbi:glycosyltransferase [Panacagrimonas sp.]|uniref:glycosyltransferase n=1 Tax=Panacagrimonas sp. TaxID=2480088 RepID=UPI003B52A9E0